MLRDRASRKLDVLRVELVAVGALEGAVGEGAERSGVGGAGDRVCLARGRYGILNTTHNAEKKNLRTRSRYQTRKATHIHKTQKGPILDRVPGLFPKGGRRGRGNPTPAPLSDLGAVGVRVVRERVERVSDATRTT